MRSNHRPMLMQFNIESPDSDLFKDQLRIYRNISAYAAPIAPPLWRLHILLTIPELTHNQVIVFHDSNATRIRVDPTPRYILLESWTVSFTPSSRSSPSSSAAYASEPPSSQDRAEIALSTVYKQSISVFRSLYTLLRVLPAWRLHKRSARRSRTRNTNSSMGIEVRVANAERALESGILDFGESCFPCR